MPPFFKILMSSIYFENVWENLLLQIYVKCARFVIFHHTKSETRDRWKDKTNWLVSVNIEQLSLRILRLTIVLFWRHDQFFVYILHANTSAAWHHIRDKISYRLVTLQPLYCLHGCLRIPFKIILLVMTFI